ncbi:hypothetical protein SBRY_60003 [Actinacidiphila bryophytorum]|uniref:Uncharacterized protein n=1 Tax=Actinacidiphila bryophytorum TaxID=1436133 RepID=A0A9W4H5Q7_9ACTN|nr:hypothetical protein SBRY_60003 [Actinacidiphila bryophytorum]
MPRSVPTGKYPTVEAARGRTSHHRCRCLPITRLPPPTEQLLPPRAGSCPQRQFLRPHTPLGKVVHEEKDALARRCAERSCRARQHDDTRTHQCQRRDKHRCRHGVDLYGDADGRRDLGGPVQPARGGHRVEHLDRQPRTALRAVAPEQLERQRHRSRKHRHRDTERQRQQLRRDDHERRRQQHQLAHRQLHRPRIHHTAHDTAHHASDDASAVWEWG